MKLKILNIIFSSNEEFMSDLKTALFKGGNTKLANESITFDSIETFKRLMTSNKLEILMAIARFRPESIKQLAKQVNREYPHVLKDCKSLEILGFIQFDKVEGARKQFIPKRIFEYDIIRVRSHIEEIFSITEKSNKVLLSAKVS